MARARRSGTINIGKIGRMAQDMTLPEGLVYQIQFASTLKRLSIEDFGGLWPVYDRITAKLQRVYTVGMFRKYDDAVMELNLVRKQGFPEATVVAWKDGRQIPVQQARQEENEQ